MQFNNKKIIVVLMIFCILLLIKQNKEKMYNFTSKTKNVANKMKAQHTRSVFLNRSIRPWNQTFYFI